MLATLLCLVLVPGADTGADQQARGSQLDKLLADGQKAIDEGNFPNAFQLLDEAKKIAPDDARVLYLTGLGYLQQAEQGIEQNQGGGFVESTFIDSENLLRRAADVDPASIDIAKALGRCLLKQGKEDEAAKQLDTAESLGARDPAFYVELGDAHFGVSVRQRDANEGDQGAVELAAAEQAYRKGRAEVLVQVLAKVSPEKLVSATNLGTALQQEVIEAVGRSEWSGTYSLLCRQLGAARTFAKDAAGAYEALREGLQVAPGDSEAHQALFKFVTESDSSKLDDAIRFYAAFASEDPLRFWFLAQLEVSRGNKSYNDLKPRDATLHYLSAIAAFQTSVAIEPSYEPDAKVWLAACHSYAGYALTNAKSYAQAEKQFLEALHLNPELQNATDGLNELGGKLYTASENNEIPKKDVREFFAHVTEVVPDKADWWNNLGLFARDTEQYEQSLAAYDKAVALEPDNARFINDRALILYYHLHRDLDRAEADFKRAAELGRKHYEDAKDDKGADPGTLENEFEAFTDALVNLARLQHSQHRVPECRATLEDLLKVDPGRPEGMELRAQLAEEDAARAEK